MKIKFIKEYVAVDPVPTSGIIHRYRVGETEEITPYTAQWLINNGFAEEVKESGWWKPQNGEAYYSLNSYGSVSLCTCWKNDRIDKWRYSMGNVFKTEKATERYCDYLKAIAIVREDEGVLTPEQVNELIKDEGLAHYVGYMGNRSNGEVLCGCTMSFDECWMPVGVILFDSEAHADSSLRKHPSEWKIIVNYDWSRE